MVKVPRKASQLAASLVYAAIALYVVVNAVTHPFYNWDVFGYVGSVVSWSSVDSAATFSTSIENLKANLPDWVFSQHIQSTLCANAAVFHEQLPVYQVKPLYNAAIWLVHQFGPSVTAASWIVSSLSMAALYAILWLWKPHFMAREFWLALVVAITFLFPMAMDSLAAFSTPDAISTLFSVTAFYAWLARRNMLAFFVCALFAQLARPDAVILSGAFIAYCALFAPSPWRIEKKDAALGLLLLATGYIAVYKLAGGYSLETFFIYSFLQRLSYPGHNTRHLSFAEYWNVLSSAIPAFITVSRTATMLAWSATATFAYMLQGNKETRVYFHLLLLSWAALAARFAVFPSWGDDRYYFSYFLIMLYSGGEVLGGYAIMLRQKHRAHLKHEGTHEENI